MKKMILLSSIIIILLNLIFGKLEKYDYFSENSNKYLSYAQIGITSQDFFDIKDYERILTTKEESAAGTAAFVLLVIALSVVYLPEKGYEKFIIKFKSTYTKGRRKKG